jgi:hypothetical protein
MLEIILLYRFTRSHKGHKILLSNSVRAWKNANVKTDNLYDSYRIVKHRRFHIWAHRILPKKTMRTFVKSSMSNYVIKSIR